MFDESGFGLNSKPNLETETLIPLGFSVSSRDLRKSEEPVNDFNPSRPPGVCAPIFMTIPPCSFFLISRMHFPVKSILAAMASMEIFVEISSGRLPFRSKLKKPALTDSSRSPVSEGDRDLEFGAESDCGRNWSP